jgi:hypothetical protein
MPERCADRLVERRAVRGLPRRRTCVVEHLHRQAHPSLSGEGRAQDLMTLDDVLERGAERLRWGIPNVDDCLDPSLRTTWLGAPYPFELR